MNPHEYEWILDRLGWTRSEAMKRIEPAPDAFMYFLYAVCEKSGRQYVLDRLAEAQKRMPIADEEEADPASARADDDGWPITGMSGPISGKRLGDTWHRKK